MITRVFPLRESERNIFNSLFKQKLKYETNKPQFTGQDVCEQPGGGTHIVR